MATRARTLLGRARLARGLSLAQAAVEIGCTGAALSYWESGARIPSHDWRLVIERWSGGSVSRDLWPVRKRDAAAARRARAA